MNKFFKYGKGKIRYTDKGRGNAVILVHGYLETLEIWDSFSRKLAGKYRVISIDLPGHGGSDLIAETQTMELMAEAIKELISGTGLKKVFLTGHSLGGYIVLAFADLYPEMLYGYCLFHSHPFADVPETIEKREREIALVKAGGKDLMYPENVVKMFATVNLQKFSAELQRSGEIASTISGEGIVAVLKGMMKRPSRLEVMQSGKVPCLWILGAMDNHINCELARARVKLPTNAQLAILKNSGHMGFVEEEKESLEIINSFIKRLE
jgi:pimeloyl-ACP methyl ester carboxylesterase